MATRNHFQHFADFIHFSVHLRVDPPDTPAFLLIDGGFMRLLAPRVANRL
jgi:hypothetical protein